MTFKDIINKFSGRNKERKEKFKEYEDDFRMQKLVEDRQKSANERELERYMKEDREKSIKRELDWHRKKRDKEYTYGHNPLKIKNITNKSDFEILKQKNLFK